MKLLVILLIVGVLLFVGLMVWGSSNHSSKAEPSPDNFDAGQYPLLGSFDSALGSFGPKVKSDQLQPARTVFDLMQTQTGYSVRVLPDPNHKFRRAKFLVQPVSCAEVTFTALDKKLPDKVKNPQKSGERKDLQSSEFALTVFEAGGTLTVNYALGRSGLCKVTLE